MLSKQELLTFISKYKFRLITVAIFTVGFATVMSVKELKTENKHAKKIIETLKFQRELTKQINFEDAIWPSDIQVDGKNFKLKYTFNKKLEKYIKSQLRRFFTKNASVVVIDNNTGEILSAVDYTFKGRHFGNRLTFSTTHPAASLIKIVTAAALLEEKKVSPETRFRCRGRGTTLYRYQLDSKNRSWDRKITLKNAFAYSNNVVFARAAQANLKDGQLSAMARSFGFNKNIYSDLLLSTSLFLRPTDEYNLAEKASGFNRHTRISPAHGALLSMIVANGGYYKPLKVLKSVQLNGKEVYDDLFSEVANPQRILTEKSARQLKSMMEQVPVRGTAARHMRRVVRRFKKYLSIGGKTGRISGGLPEGTRDWFTAFATPRYGQDRGISIGIMQINGKSWYIKSSYIAKKIIEYYYTRIIPIKKRTQNEIVKSRTITKGES